ncbi:MAG: hypothetical protein QNJ98_12845 [Planctomycetota bacterium]|nr:hypothetical protein [Planctomycetota bacterium]
MSIPRSRTTRVVLLCLLLGACTAYRPLPATVATADASLPDVPEGPLDFEHAVHLLVLRHPSLRAARAEIRAVNLDPGPNPVVGRIGVLDGDATDVTLEADVLSLFGIGPRSAAQASARALRDERVRRHNETARDLVAELAEAYAVERVLASMAPPAPELDVDAFREAGLASEASLRAADAALAEATAESRVIDAELQDARRRIVELTGAAPGSDVVVVSAAPAWPAVPATDDTRLLLARGDLQTQFARYRLADRRFKEAVVRQYPGLELRLGGNIELDAPLQLVRIRLPLDAGDQARVAQSAREAAHEHLRAGVLAARHDAESRRLAWASAQADLQAARSRREAARALFEAERARVETDPTAFASLVLVVGTEVGAARAERRAAVYEARARVRAARAAGWPGAEVVSRAQGAKGGGS